MTKTNLYIARDCDGSLYLYDVKPYKGNLSWVVPYDSFYHPVDKFPGSAKIQWTDKDATELYIR